MDRACHNSVAFRRPFGRRCRHSEALRYRLLFGGALATAAWPLRQALVHRASLSRGTAALLLLLLSIALIAAPVVVVAPHLAEQLGKAMQQTETYFATAPELPSWMAHLPFIGKRLEAAWSRIVELEGNIASLSELYAASLEKALLGVAQALADSVVQVILSVAVATTFWTNGENIVGTLHASLQRLGGPVADQVIDVAAGAIRGVAYGVVGTAAIQAALLGVGLMIAGIPGAAMLGFVALLIAISQIGAPLLALIWGGASWWLLSQEHRTWAILMIVWGIFISTIDNLIKPWLIGMGIRMPLSLTLLGVFGGFLAFGFLGLFVGPTLVAVAFHLLNAWRVSSLSDSDEPA